MIGAVVVRTACDGYRHLVRIAVSGNDKVSTGLGCAVRTVGAERGFFGEVTFRASEPYTSSVET